MRKRRGQPPFRYHGMEGRGVRRETCEAISSNDLQQPAVPLPTDTQDPVETFSSPVPSSQPCRAIATGTQNPARV